MNLSKPFFIIMMFFISTNFQNCTDQCGSCKDIKKIDTDSRNWFTFNLGSKWVYRLSEDTTVFDTLTCDFIDSNRSNMSVCVLNYAHAISCSQIITINLVHSNKIKFSLPYDSSKKAYITILTYLRGPESTIFDILFESGQVHASGRFLGLPIIKGEDYGEYSLKLIDLNLQINNLSFDSVVYSEVNYKGNKNFVDKFWLKKNVGIVKYSGNNGQTWELVNYKLEP